MAEILIECSKCGIEMKYSLFKTHICMDEGLDPVDGLEELIDKILEIDDIEA